MRSNEITFKKIASAIKKHYHCVIITFIICIIIGLICGFINSKKVHSTKYDFTRLDFVDTNSLKDELSYYENCIKILNSKIKEIDIYTETIQSYIKNSEIKKDMELLYKENKNCSEILNVELCVEIENKAIIKPSVYEITINKLINQLEKMKYKKIKYETDVDVLSSIKDKLPDTIDISDLLSSAISYGDLVSDLKRKEDYLEKIINKSISVIKVESKDMDQKIDLLIQKIDKNIESVNNIMEHVVKEEKLIVSAGEGCDLNNPDSYGIYIKNTHSQDTPQNIFLSFVVFFALIGVAFSVVLAIIIEVK